MTPLDYQCHGCRKHLPQATCQHEVQWKELEKKLRAEIASEIRGVDLESEAQEISSDYYAAVKRTKMVLAAIVGAS